MLQDIGFDKAIKKISDPGLRFLPLDNAYTQVWMTINDIDAPYQLNQMNLHELSVLLNRPRSPLKDDLYVFYRALTENECEAFVDELAICYQKAGLINCKGVFFDNHTIPYYGKSPIGFVYHTTRNMPITGIHLAQLNDFNGNFILFKLIPSTTEFADILKELLKRMKRVLNITTPLILVVDREAEALTLFQELSLQHIYFVVAIRKNSKASEEMEAIPEADFKEKFRENEKIVETEITLKGIPFRAGVILHESGKRYGFRTNIPREVMQSIKEIAWLIPARWRQENKFEELKNGENGDKIAGYEFIDAQNIHLQKKYEILQEQLLKVEIRIKKHENERECLEKRYRKKDRIFTVELNSKDEGLEKLEKSLRKAGEKKTFRGRLKTKMEQRDICTRKYTDALSKLKDKMEEATGKLEKDQARKMEIKEELKNIDLNAKFVHLNPASTTFSIAVKEAATNVNSELTRRISHNGRPMKVNRAKKVLYRLPGTIIEETSTRTIEFAPIRNKPLGKRIEDLCDWVSRKEIIDTDGKKMVFEVKTT